MVPGRDAPAHGLPAMLYCAYNPAVRGRPRAAREPLDSEQITEKLVEILSDRQAEEIVQIDISKVSSFADYFVIATAANVRHMKALIDTLDRDMKQFGVDLSGQEGEAESGWVLLDFEDVIVHLFSRDQREFYNLEGLWSRTAPLVRFG